MTSAIPRPPVGAVSLHLFRRPLHPELFETLAVREVSQDDYVLTVRVTPTGHVLSWQTPDLILTEITAARGEPLPGRGRVWRHRFQGEQSDAFRASPLVLYRMSAQAEVMSPKVFRLIHDDLVADGQRRGLLHLLPAPEEGGPSPLGFITADARPGCLVVNTFHTFPAECTLLKTQTLIERVG
jgi:hypothetical protein